MRCMSLHTLLHMAFIKNRNFCYQLPCCEKHPDDTPGLSPRPRRFKAWAIQRSSRFLNPLSEGGALYCQPLLSPCVRTILDLFSGLGDHHQEMRFRLKGNAQEATFSLFTLSMLPLCGHPIPLRFAVRRWIGEGAALSHPALPSQRAMQGGSTAAAAGSSLTRTAAHQNGYIRSGTLALVHTTHTSHTVSSAIQES